MSNSQSNVSKLVFALVIVALAAIVGFNYSQKSQENVTASAPSNSFERAQQQASEAVDTATEAAKQQAEQIAKDADEAIEKAAQDTKSAANSMSDKMKEMTAEQQGQLAPAAGNAPAQQPKQ